MLLLLSFILLHGVGSFALIICGNYCGPNWCNAQIQPECSNPVGSGCKKTMSDCSEMVPTDNSCADSCCKIHDSCCGSPNRKPCNDEIISCLEKCENGPNNKCRDPSTGLAVHPKVILFGMKLNPYGCCGTRCDGSGNSNATTSTKEDELYFQHQAKLEEASKGANTTGH
jgi:hypothetical protein